MSDKDPMHLSNILEQYNNICKRCRPNNGGETTKEWLKGYSLDNNLSSNDLFKLAAFIKIHLIEVSLDILSAKDFLVWVMVVCLINVASQNLLSKELNEWVGLLLFSFLTLWGVIRLVINMRLKRYIHKYEALRMLLDVLSREKEN